MLLFVVITRMKNSCCTTKMPHATHHTSACESATTASPAPKTPINDIRPLCCTAWNRATNTDPMNPPTPMPRYIRPSSPPPASSRSLATNTGICVWMNAIIVSVGTMLSRMA